MFGHPKNNIFTQNVWNPVKTFLTLIWWLLCCWWFIPEELITYLCLWPYLFFLPQLSSPDPCPPPLQFSCKLLSITICSNGSKQMTWMCWIVTNCTKRNYFPENYDLLYQLFCLDPSVAMLMLFLRINLGEFKVWWLWIKIKNIPFCDISERYVTEIYDNNFIKVKGNY